MNFATGKIHTYTTNKTKLKGAIDMAKIRGKPEND